MSMLEWRQVDWKQVDWKEVVWRDSNDTTDFPSALKLLWPVKLTDAGVLKSAVGPDSEWSYVGPQYNDAGVSIGVVPAVHGDRGAWCGPVYTQSVQNPSCAGAVIGTPGTLPIGWRKLENGCVISVVGVGDGYVDIRISGTATTANAVYVMASPVAAVAGQTWTGSVFLTRLAGAWPVSSKVVIRERYVAETSNTAISGDGEYVVTRTLTNGSTSAVELIISLDGFGPTDVTFRVSRPNLTQTATKVPYINSAVTVPSAAGTAVGNGMAWDMADNAGGEPLGTYGENLVAQSSGTDGGVLVNGSGSATLVDDVLHAEAFGDKVTWDIGSEETGDVVHFSFTPADSEIAFVSYTGNTTFDTIVRANMGRVNIVRKASGNKTTGQYKICGVDSQSLDISISDVQITKNQTSLPSITSLVCLGDSITYFERWITYVGGALGITPIDTGINGNRTAQMVARFETDVAAHSPSHVHILAGINDIRESVSASQIIANLQTLIASVKAISAVPYISTILPFGQDSLWTTTRQTVLETVNTWIRSQEECLYIEQYESFVDSDGISMIPSLTIDGLHPSADASSLIGINIINAIATYPDYMKTGAVARPAGYYDGQGTVACRVTLGAASSAVTSDNNILTVDDTAVGLIYAAASNKLKSNDGTNTAEVSCTWAANDELLIVVELLASTFRIGFAKAADGSITWGAAATYDGGHNGGAMLRLALLNEIPMWAKGVYVSRKTGLTAADIRRYI